MIKILINIGLYLFLIFSLSIIFFYFCFLYDKISRPEFKNMNSQEFIWTSIFVGCLIMADIFILRRFIKRIKRKNYEQLPPARNQIT
jgi:multisubunit Na+/H+ antiporter MnhB subunit